MSFLVSNSKFPAFSENSILLSILNQDISRDEKVWFKELKCETLLKITLFILNQKNKKGGHNYEPSKAEKKVGGG